MIYLFYICAFILSFFVLVLVHEAGHFFGAILFNVKIERVSIGFGKPFYKWQKKKNGTEYVLAPIPLGGYVKLQNKRTLKLLPPYRSQAFNDKPLLAKLGIIAFGPIANIFFAFFAFWLMFVIGFESPRPIVDQIIPNSIAGLAGMLPGEEIIEVDKRGTDTWSDVAVAMLARLKDEGTMVITTKRNTYILDLKDWSAHEYAPNPLVEFGLVQYKPLVLPVIYKIVKQSPAEKYGLLTGDRIVSIEGIEVGDWEDFVKQIKLYPEKKVKLQIQREEEKIDLEIITGWKFGRGWKKIGFLGANIDPHKTIWPVGMMKVHKYPPLTAVKVAMQQMDLFFGLNGIIFAKMLFGKISFGIFGGPLSTFIASGQALNQGFSMFLGFLAMISLSIAMVNFLPVPGLDGGQIIMILYEGITRRSLSMRVQILMFRLGVAVFVLLVLRTTANDIMRIFG